MKFYHCFFTDLPDQFVEANIDRLIKWADGWKDKNRYYRRSMIVDTVALDFFGNAKTETWPRLKAQSKVLIDRWIATKGANYNGGYWGTLTEDQRNPDRVTCDPGRDPADDLTVWTTFRPGSFYPLYPSTGRAARFGVAPVSVRQLPIGDFEEKPKPPLKREGVVAGEIVGYRCWRIERGTLRSVYQSDMWKPGEILEGRELGDWDSRGIHAWKDPASKQYHEYIRSYLNSADDPFMWAFLNGDRKRDERRPAMVTGTVFLWGDVVEHERGYRAEYARVRSLDWLYPDATMMGREQQTLEALRLTYSVLRPDRESDG